MSFIIMSPTEQSFFKTATNALPNVHNSHEIIKKTHKNAHLYQILAYIHIFHHLIMGYERIRCLLSRYTGSHTNIHLPV